MKSPLDKNLVRGMAVLGACALVMYGAPMLVPRDPHAPAVADLWRAFDELPRVGGDVSATPPQHIEHGGPAMVVQRFRTTHSSKEILDYYRAQLTRQGWHLVSEGAHGAKDEVVSRYCRLGLSTRVEVKSVTSGAAYRLALSWSSSPSDSRDFCPK